MCRRSRGAAGGRLLWVILGLVGLAACSTANEPVDASSTDDPPGADERADTEGTVDGELPSPVVEVLASGQDWTSLASSGGSLWLATADGLERRDPVSGELQFTLDESVDVTLTDCGNDLLAVDLGMGQARLLDVRSNRYAMDLMDDAIAAVLPTDVEEQAAYFGRCHGPSGRAVVGAESISDTSENAERSGSIAVVEVGRDGFTNPAMVGEGQQVAMVTLESVLLLSGGESGILGAWGPEGRRTVDEEALSCPCVEFDGAVWTMPASSTREEWVDRIEVAQRGLVPEPILLKKLSGGAGDLYLPVTEGVLVGGKAQYLSIGGRIFLLDRNELLEVDVVNGEFLSVTALPGIDTVVDVVADGDRVFVLAETGEGGSSVYEVALGSPEASADRAPTDGAGAVG